MQAVRVLIMAQGGKGLARRLDAVLIGQENIDLMAGNGEPKAMSGRLRAGGQINSLMLLIVDIDAGILATAAQITPLYGLGIYVVNLYGFTVLFPGFSVTHDWVTLLTHLVVGVGLDAGGLRSVT